MNMIYIFSTLHKKDLAIKIGKGLLKGRTIACYSLFPIESSYWWKGKILDEKETFMIIKTRKENFKKIEDYFKKHSDYEVPELVTVKPDQVNIPYLNWVMNETKT